MAYSGEFFPRHPDKYLGDPTKIFYRSLWERRVMVHLDNNSTILKWSSEEIVIPYLSPVDSRWHRYFPDFFIRVQKKEGLVESMILEVKPMKQSQPPQKRSRVTKQYIQEVVTWGVNEAKWKAAEEYCRDRNWKFRVITEKDLFS